MIKKFAKRNEEYFYLVFRVLVGLLFAQHGLQKLFGFLGGQKVELFSLFGLAGVIELLGGLFLVFGLFTRISALVGVIEMSAAFFIAHVPQGIIPIMNRGELALLYLACFLVIFVYGSRKFGVDNSLTKEYS